MFRSKLRKGDEVIVIAGGSKGHTGKIDRFDREKNRVYVAGVNVRKKHQRATGEGSEGGIVDKIMPIHISNLALVDPKEKKATRIGFQVLDGKKVRVAKRSASVL
jgi:large subunit ribosomal protein L24